MKIKFTLLDKYIYLSLLCSLNSDQIISANIDCGWPGIGEEQCKERGCNWSTEEGLYCEGVPGIVSVNYNMFTSLF